MACRGRQWGRGGLVTALVLATAISILATVQVLTPCRCTATDYHLNPLSADITFKQHHLGHMKFNSFKILEQSKEERSTLSSKAYEDGNVGKQRTGFKDLQPEKSDSLDSEGSDVPFIMSNLSLAEISHMTWGQGLDVDAFLAWARSYVTSNASDSLVVPDLQLRAETACTSETELLVLMPSVPELMFTRELVRQTWAGTVYGLPWPRRRLRLKTSLVFVLGVEGLAQNKINALEDESRDYGDLVTASFFDSYRNLTLKMITGLNWVAQYCPSAAYILKCDLDTFVNLPLLTQLLVSVGDKLPRFVFGGRHDSLNPPVLRSGKWGIRQEDYPFPRFPPHVMGHSYVVTAGLAPQMVELARRLPTIPSEDSFITGVLASVLRATRLHHDAFANNFKRLLPCNIVFNEDVTMTKMGMAHLLLMWRHVLTNTCTSRELPARINMVMQPGKKKQQPQGKPEELQQHKQPVAQQETKDTQQEEWKNSWQNLESKFHQQPEQPNLQQQQQVQSIKQQEQGQSLQDRWEIPWQVSNRRDPKQQQEQRQNLQQQHMFVQKPNEKQQTFNRQQSELEQRERHLRQEELDILHQLEPHAD